MKKLVIVFFLCFASQIIFAQTTATTDTAKATSVSNANLEMPSTPYDLQQYLRDSIRYPSMEKAAGKEGVVYMSFYVEKDGSITNAMVKRSSGYPGFDREAVRVISAMPKWNPGKNNGEVVRAEVVLPVRFSLLAISEPKKKKSK